MDEPNIVKTRFGLLRPEITQHPANGNNKVFGFLSLPYAETQNCENRFKQSKIYTKYSSTTHRDCSIIKACPWQIQNKEPIRDIRWTPDYKIMNEDSLNINIWTPDLKFHEIKPVLVWIYGGGFCQGASSLSIYHGATLSSKLNAVVVTFDYRLGPLGFLCLPEIGIEGNMGIQDQKLALQWIKQNIKDFGGDSDNISVFGESAGAVSISLFLYDIECFGLFQNVFLQSGCFFCPTLVATRQEIIENSKEFLKRINVDEKEDIWMQLKTLDLQLIFDPQYCSIESGPCAFTWKPWIDKSKLVNVLGNVNVYFLLTASEGSCWLLDQIPQFERDENTLTLNKVLEKFSIYQPFYLIKNQLDILRHYSIGNSTTARIVSEILSDSLFKFPMFKFVEDFMNIRIKTGESAKVKGFLFDYRSSQQMHSYPEWAGVIHGDEIHYLFGVPFREHLQRDQDLIISNLLVNILQKIVNSTSQKVSKQPHSHFSWPNFNLTSGKIIHLTENASDTKTHSLTEREISLYNFWKSILV